jgi:hypothetical protein
MNPIIKQLAEEAGMNIKTNVIGTALVFGTFEGYKTSHITVEELEKFAELIVRDCAGYIHGHELFTALLNRYGVTE